MAALVDRIGDPALAGDLLGGLAPGVAGLSAAMQQKDGIALLAEDIGGELVAVGAEEGRRGRCDVARHSRSLSRNCSTAALKTLSPTASM